MNYLFEVSWQVCNKVGGVNTVIKTKAKEAVKEFQNRYMLFGPLLDENPEFQESKDNEHEELRNVLQSLNLNFKIGTWETEGNPLVVLVDYKNRYEVNKLLYSYWRDYGVDSYGCQWDYIEPALFGTTVGEAIVEIYKKLISPKKMKAILHCHEWRTGTTLLYVKKHLSEIATVFTTHSTTLGRCISGLGRDLFKELDRINPVDEAKTYGISPRHILETVVAKESDCFTTISGITALEAKKVLNKEPDFIIENALSFDTNKNFPLDKNERDEKRNFLLTFCKRFLKKDLPTNTKFFVTSGRYEFGNKGYDVFLEALGRVNENLLNGSLPPVVALFLVSAGDKGVHENVRKRVKEEKITEGAVGITTHRLYDEAHDPIVGACYKLGLKNAQENKVNIIFSPAFLDGVDGAFDRTYLDILAGADLGVFPSFYESWGYSPLESMSKMVPAITSDIAGIGEWASNLKDHKGLFIIKRKGQDRGIVVQELSDVLMTIIKKSSGDLEVLREESYQLAKRADWNKVFYKYVEAYNKALKEAEKRFDILGTDNSQVNTLAMRSSKPYYRSFTVVSDLPEEINKIYDLAYNLWWTWTPDARELFNMLGDDLWKETGCNPVKMLNILSPEKIAQKCKNQEFISLYKDVIAKFEAYMNDKASYVKYGDKLNNTNPISYFSMEYGFHECMPIYSGGLGVLSGDHLKSSSDINIPLIGVGLFYRETYFKQVINKDGYQQEEYEKQDCSMLPMKALLDENSNEARVSVMLPGRLLYLRIWIVNIGRIKLYLLDSDCEENEQTDRLLTARLYGGDRRMRIKQEIALGIGGIKLIRDVLKINPAVYHLNEGHCAFLVLERINSLMQQCGLSYQEAREAVKASTVFTTHTPVPAGNEVFEFDLLRHYLSYYVQKLNITWEQFIELGCENHIGDTDKFSMTVFALKLTSKANAVAKLHGVVSRKMWQNVWKGINEEDLPIFSITNGIHTQTWLSRNMRKLYDKYLHMNWGVDDDSLEVWSKVDDIPDEEFWNVKLEQKQKFIDRIKKKIRQDYERRGEEKNLIEATVNNLRSDVLTIGFARRFATYKRSDLFLRDWNRIVRILSDTQKPVQIIVAGKAHPADVAGKEIIQHIVTASRAMELKGRVVFLENYDMGVARLLTRGVDVWLNNPVRPHEASGTSGMKVCPNLGVNFSILDGWWDEGYSEDVGFKIDAGQDFNNRDYQDDMDNKVMLDVLENKIIPIYYDRNEKGYSKEWMKIAKNSVKKLSPYFSTQRMLKEYYDLSYEPTGERKYLLEQDSFKGLKEITEWKRQISNLFATVHILKISVDGITSDLMPAGGKVVVSMKVDAGRLSKEELLAELLLIKKGDSKEEQSIIKVFDFNKQNEDGTLEYFLNFDITESGNYSYAVRIMPYHKLLSSVKETGLVCWG